MRQKINALALILMLVMLWLLVRGYQGLTGDAQIYAFQALARIHPQFMTDLFLQNVSQDQFTIFSPLYAWFIGAAGLEQAARLLTLIFTAWFLTASWSLAAALAGRAAAWLAVAFLLIIAGDYGGAGVFRFLEPYLTARLPAEALIVTGLACYARGRRGLGILLALAALLIHPLMALPGLLLLLWLGLSGRAMIAAAIATVSAALCVAVAAVHLPAAAHLFALMDAPWLEVVRERSQFLFMQLWAYRDWETNARPFICLGFTAIAVNNRRLRKLCAAAALVGAAGLAVGLIAGQGDPVAILVQGQAWRWAWVTVFVSALMLPFTALRIMRDETCGPLCTILLVAGWTVPAVDGTACVSLALVIWVARRYVGARGAHCLRWASILLGFALGLWILLRSGAIISSRAYASAKELPGADWVRSIFGLRASAAALAMLVCWRVRASRAMWVPAIVCVMMLALSLYILQAAFRQSFKLPSPADSGEFADWTVAIPPASTVLVSPTNDVGAFVWFTLQRPNYLALDQSAGVVFSRATALEVKRRSEVLLPLMDPNWKILTSLRAHAAGTRRDGSITRPLTAAGLTRICGDPQLGFVVSPQDVGFGPLRHEHPGAWKNWNLYDCRKVRSRPPAA